MESLKPVLLLVVLSGVGYGVYIALNRAPPLEPPLGVAPAWNQPVEIEAGTPMSSDDQRAVGPANSSTAPSAPRSEPPAAVDTPSRMDGPIRPAPFGAGATVPSRSSLDESPPSDPSASNAASSSFDATSYGSGNRYAGATNDTASQSGAKAESFSPPPAHRGDENASPELARQRHEFDAALRRAQSAINAGKLVDGLRELSDWHDHPAVPQERQQELDDLLSQLAGTVVYSREHWLTAAHIVERGETLETIALRYEVPWQLLAKINGIDSPNAIVPGEELKVVRGPFHAQLSRQRDWLAVFVDGLYAGKFPIEAAGDVTERSGTLPVAKFSAGDPANQLRQPYLSLGGDLILCLPDEAPAPHPGTLRIGQRDMSDVFDILSDRSQVTIRR